MVHAQPSLIGVIACGGQSSRMGSDKSLTAYHGKPQRYFLYDLLKPVCENVFLSCNEKQVDGIKNGYTYITDKKEFRNCGPLSGLLSAFQEHPGKSILYIGCDYPFVTIDNLEYLISMRDGKLSAVCYLNTETNVREPMVSIYEYSSFSILLSRFRKNKHSLREFLEECETLSILPSNNNILRSIDTPYEYRSVMLEINKSH